MLTPVLNVALCAGAVLFCVFLFRTEERRGERLFKSVRLHLDFYVLKLEHGIRHFFQYLSMDLLRQVLHYIFHTVLGAMLHLLKRYEKRVQDLQRSNRMHARKSHTERTTRNKLDLIAEHKIAVALTDEEKQHRKDKMLSGE